MCFVWRFATVKTYWIWFFCVFSYPNVRTQSNVACAFLPFRLSTAQVASIVINQNEFHRYNSKYSPCFRYSSKSILVVVWCDSNLVIADNDLIVTAYVGNSNSMYWKNKMKKMKFFFALKLWKTFCIFPNKITIFLSNLFFYRFFSFISIAIKS